MEKGNPFVGYGKVVSGERFIGRQRQLARLTARIGAEPSAVALVGMPRVGKTSLAENCRRGLGSRSDVASLYASLADYSDAGEFLDDVNEMVRRIADERGVILGSGREGGGNDVQRLRSLREHLQALHVQRQCRVVLFFDEFDNIRRIERGDLLIRRLRTVISRSDESQASVVLISRRPLGDLEEDVGTISTLSGVCEQMVVGPLDQEYASEFIARGHGIFDSASERDLEALLYYSGMVPYLVEMVLCKSYDRQSLAEGIRDSMMEIEEYYRCILDLMRSYKYEDAFKATLISRSSDEYIISRNRLEYLGYLIRGPNAGQVRAWCSGYAEYVGVKVH
jgi:hypothetical protein